jgi:hypothetical protein
MRYADIVGERGFHHVVPLAGERISVRMESSGLLKKKLLKRSQKLTTRN